MSDRDLMQQALDAMMTIRPYEVVDYDQLEASITALRQALVDADAAEREKVAQWMTRQGYATGHGDTTEDLLKELEWQIAEREREACAKACEEVESRAEELWDKFAYPEDQGMASGARQCTTAIRARGEK